ncbi:collagen triple helix repeat domain-containing protein [Clostridium acidurici 9a] [Clostridioides difficile]|nr:collagen triple helix repeat domain-containing protein [Clostridium acidurici 9a] [Clostridioides difficile]
MVLGGTTVSLPNNQNLSTFTVNGANTVFTVPSTGTYLVTYEINITASVLMSSRILLNGTTLPGTVFAPLVAVSDLSATTITPLAAGDRLELQLFGVIAASVLQRGAGATLTVIRLA